MAAGPARWRLGSKQRSKGDYFWLETGRAAERRSLTLGFVTAAQAELALQALNADELEHPGRVLSLEPAQAVAYLLDPMAVDPFGPEPVDFGALTLRDYFEGHYAESRSVEVPKTWRTEAGYWRSAILPKLGGLRLRDVDAHEVADYLDGLTIERPGHARLGEPASGSTKRLHRSALQALLNFAHRRKHLPQHVDLGVFRIKGSTKRARVKPDPLTLPELARLLDASSPKHRAMWAVGAGQGLRPSELTRVQWQDVDWTGRVLAVRGEKTDYAADRVPMTPLTVSELRSWWRANGCPASGVAFPQSARSAEGYSSISGYKRALASAAEAAGITRQVTPYLLRDSFATIAWSLGIPKDVTRRIGRWADDTMLDAVYCRPRPEDLVELVSAFELPG